MATQPGCFYPRSKRVLDLALATLAAPALLVTIAVGWYPIRRSTGGSVLMRQVRVGSAGAPFVLWKFRTMRVAAADVPSHEMDPALITRLGRTMRRLKLDELPQLINVLKGEMSFVGPRPCLPSQSDLIAAREHLGVYKMVPGITGVAQVQGIDMSDPAHLAAVDAGYVAQWSMRSDLAVVLRTFVGRGRGDAADRG